MNLLVKGRKTMTKRSLAEEVLTAVHSINTPSVSDVTDTGDIAARGGYSPAQRMRSPLGKRRLPTSMSAERTDFNTQNTPVEFDMS